MRLQAAAAAGLEQVELRNDLPQRGEIDQLGAKQFRLLAERLGVRVATINAVQKFNSPAHRESAAAESARLVALARAIKRNLDISMVGMVHASGVRRDRLNPDLRDEDRGLVDHHDAIGNREQIARLRRLGYAGPVSLEPFAPDLAALTRAELVPTLERSLRLLEADEAAL